MSADKASNATRAKLVAEGLRSMIVNGYDGIGLNAILDAARVPKGSFYYFFKSKEAFAEAILEAYEGQYAERRKVLLNDESVSPLQRLKNYFDEVERVHVAESPLRGCFYGVLGQTAQMRTPAFRAKLSVVFSHWETQLRVLLEKAQVAGEIDRTLDAQEAAAFIIDAYEGMLIRMKVDGNTQAFTRFKRFALGALSPHRQGAPRDQVIP